MRHPERILVVGTGQLTWAIVDAIESSPQGRRAKVQLVAEDGSDELPVSRYQIAGFLRDLKQIIACFVPDRIIIALYEWRGILPVDQLVETKVSSRIIVEAGEDACERLTGKLSMESMSAGSVLFSGGFRVSPVTEYLARAYSLVAALCGLLLAAPLFAVIACIIKLDSPGPIFFVQERIGYHGRPFRLFKFRTMCVTVRPHSEWAGDNEDRITRTGKWLRRYHLDELPQFLNVLRGDMNLVGPRPHPAVNRELFTLVSRNTPKCGEQIPYYSLRSAVRPGITGWAQVRYKYANGLNEEMEKLRYDLYYVKHRSLKLDIRIMLETVKVIVLGQGTRIVAERRKQGMTNARANPSRRESEHARPGLVSSVARSAKVSSRRSERGSAERV
jgi:exopolysaccharide biosynthesis polyprenyl glycosylphosphotransferase